MLETIIQIGSATIATVGVIIAVIKTIQEGKKSKLVKLAKIVQEIPECINEAEELLGAKTGNAKRSYVLNKLYIKCLQAGIAYDEAGLTAEIENVLSTPTKNKQKE